MIKTLLLVGIIGSAQASTDIEFDSNALTLATAMSTFCPDQTQELMKGATHVGRAHLMSPRPAPGGNLVQHYTITSAATYPAPSNRTVEIATMTITRELIEVYNPAPDSPGRVWRTHCIVRRAH